MPIFIVFKQDFFTDDQNSTARTKENCTSIQSNAECRGALLCNIKDTCYAWDKNSTNLHLLDILTYNSAYKPSTLKIWQTLFCLAVHRCWFLLFCPIASTSILNEAHTYCCEPQVPGLWGLQLQHGGVLWAKLWLKQVGFHTDHEPQDYQN